MQKNIMRKWLILLNSSLYVNETRKCETCFGAHKNQMQLQQEQQQQEQQQQEQQQQEQQQQQQQQHYSRKICWIFSSLV